MDFTTLLKMSEREANAAMMKEIAGEMSGEPDLAAEAGEPSMKKLLGAADEMSMEEGIEEEPTDEEVMALAEAIGFGGDMKEFAKGVEEEQEHGPQGPAGGKFDITGGDSMEEALIAAAHLAEDPEYYTKLELLENGALDEEAAQFDGPEEVEEAMGEEEAPEKEEKEKEAPLKKEKKKEEEDSDIKEAARKKVAEFLNL